MRRPLTTSGSAMAAKFSGSFFSSLPVLVHRFLDAACRAPPCANHVAPAVDIPRTPSQYVPIFATKLRATARLPVCFQNWPVAPTAPGIRAPLLASSVRAAALHGRVPQRQVVYIGAVTRFAGAAPLPC